jgi:hypothetical protein
MSECSGCAPRLDTLEEQSDSLLEFFGGLEGELKELRRRVRWLETATETYSRDED